MDKYDYIPEELLEERPLVGPGLREETYLEETYLTEEQRSIVRRSIGTIFNILASPIDVIVTLNIKSQRKLQDLGMSAYAPRAFPYVSPLNLNKGDTPAQIKTRIERGKKVLERELKEKKEMGNIPYILNSLVNSHREFENWTYEETGDWEKAKVAADAFSDAYNAILVSTFLIGGVAALGKSLSKIPDWLKKTKKISPISIIAKRRAKKRAEIEAKRRAKRQARQEADEIFGPIKQEERKNLIEILKLRQAKLRQGISEIPEQEVLKSKQADEISEIFKQFEQKELEDLIEILKLRQAKTKQGISEILEQKEGQRFIKALEEEQAKSKQAWERLEDMLKRVRGTDTSGKPKDTTEDVLKRVKGKGKPKVKAEGKPKDTTEDILERVKEEVKEDIPVSQVIQVTKPKDVTKSKKKVKVDSQVKEPKKKGESDSKGLLAELGEKVKKVTKSQTKGGFFTKGVEWNAKSLDELSDKAVDKSSGGLFDPESMYFSSFKNHYGMTLENYVKLNKLLSKASPNTIEYIKADIDKIEGILQKANKIAMKDHKNISPTHEKYLIYMRKKFKNTENALKKIK